MQATGPRPGLIGTLRELGGGLLDSVRDRIELIAIELEEEKLRFFQLHVWISVLIFSGLMTVTLATLTVVLVFWETARVAVLGGLTAFYLGAFIAGLVAFRRHLARQPRPLAATREELNRDRTCIRGEN